MDRFRALASRATFPAAIACAVLAPLALHWCSGQTLAWLDTQRLFAPQRWIVDEAIRAFRLPLWNPHMGTGMPLLADTIHGVLHPVSLLAAWISPDRSVDLLLGGHVTCAGLGAALLARDLGASRAGAATAAFAFGMSGFVLSMIGFLNLLAGAGSLPICAAGLRRVAIDPRPANLALGVGGAALLAVSGDPEALMVGGVLALALAWEAAGWRGALRAVAAGTVGLLVAGVQLVPSAANIPRTVRAADTWMPKPTIWAFESWRLPELVVPGLLSGLDPHRDPVYAGLAGPGRWPSAGYPIPLAAGVFLGLVPMVLATAGVREGRRGRVLGLLALLFLWIALGPALGADAVLKHVPVWRAFQYSEKLVGPLTLVLATLAGLGLDAAVERRVGGRHLFAGAAVLGLAAIGACHLEASRLPSDVASLASARVVRGTWHVLVAAGALGGWLLVRDRLGVTWARIALASLTWCGMAAASPAVLHPGDPDARLRATAPTLSAGPPGPRVVTPYLHEATPSEDGSAWLDQAARLHAALGYSAYNVRSRLDSLNENCGLSPKRLSPLGADLWGHWPLAPRRYSVTHVILDPPLTERERDRYLTVTRGATRLESSAEGYEIWAVPHREWASFPSEIRAVADEQLALTATAGALASHSPSVVVEAWSHFSTAPGRILTIERGLESLRIEAETNEDATLLVNDAWWPGWEATLDDARVTIFRADAIVRAVRWPAGRHVLEMRYRPPEVRAGLLVSALGIAALAGWLALLRRAQARVRASPASAP